MNFTKQTIGLTSRVFVNSPRDRGSIPGRVIPKTQKIVIVAALLNTQYYKVKINGKVEQSRNEEQIVVVAIEKGAFGSTTLLFTYI